MTPDEHAARIAAELPNPSWAHASLAALVDLAKQPDKVEERVDALMEELQRGYILKATHDAITGELNRRLEAAEARADQLQRERDEWVIADAAWREQRDGWRNRAERAETALRQAKAALTDRASTHPTRIHKASAIVVDALADSGETT